MAELDTILEKYTDPSTGGVHGATFVVIDRNGNDVYRKSFGRRNVDPQSPRPLTPDTVTWLASQTKLTTSVAVMQIVERGLIGWDDDVRDVVPLLRDLKVITGFDQEEPILEELEGPITLRQLVTHTSGFCYDLRHPLLLQYSAWAGREDNMFSGTIEGGFHPLVFQPGTSWVYGPGLEWASQVVAKLTGMEYDGYQQKHIWEPLGAKNTTFFPAKRGFKPEDIQETGHRVKGEGSQSLKAGPSPWKFECRDALGGAGLYSTANDYIRLLAALLAGGGPILSKASVDELFRPQLGPGPMKGLREWLLDTSPDTAMSWLWAQTPLEWREVMEIQHCLCGVINTADVRGRRKKHTASWDGLPNLLWFVDRESGIAGTFLTQVVPNDDLVVREMFTELEEALYKKMSTE